MKALVTGGNGFLGTEICRQLRLRGDDVVSLSRRDAPHLRDLGVSVERGDVADLATVERAADGVDVVFHVAAKAGIWGARADFERSNVRGTESVVEACLRRGVPKLVHTSSPSIVARGVDLSGVDERAPIPERFLADYPRTKALAEAWVLRANGPRLATVALRPHLIWGPGDAQILPRLVDRANKGKLRLVGTGESLVDTTYIENAADAHLLAERALAPGAACAGKAYFISNDEPLPAREIIGRLVECAGAPRPTKRIPFAVAHAVGAVSELVYRALGREDEPMMTRFLAEELATAHWFDLSAAKRDLGYRPRVSVDEGLRRLRASFGR
ncbi:MAG: NAD-dependent epimerase/dehydratase family protein [Polyangiaceae bacterium]|nr:NAD-dependent epimerase/dehydratase family protein [Polyangiaceae bacterium]